jgi:hypothetical protein
MKKTIYFFFTCLLLCSCAYDEHQRGSACANRTIELGVSTYARSDIVSCGTNGLRTLEDARLLCNIGWHMCSIQEHRGRNDDAWTELRVVAIIDEPDCLIVNDPGAVFGSVLLSIDESGPGNGCPAPRCIDSYGMISRENALYLTGDVDLYAVECCR